MVLGEELPSLFKDLSSSCLPYCSRLFPSSVEGKGVSGLTTEPRVRVQGASLRAAAPGCETVGLQDFLFT